MKDFLLGNLILLKLTLWFVNGLCEVLTVNQWEAVKKSQITEEDFSYLLQIRNSKLKVLRAFSNFRPKSFTPWAVDIVTHCVGFVWLRWDPPGIKVAPLEKSLVTAKTLFCMNNVLIMKIVKKDPDHRIDLKQEQLNWKFSRERWKARIGGAQRCLALPGTRPVLVAQVTCQRTPRLA